MSAVSSSSPLIVFAAIGHFELLRAVFTEILIPPQVWEVVAGLGGGRPGTHEVSSEPWIHIREPAGTSTVEILSRDMDRSEAGAIALCLDLPDGTPIILDGLEARQAAKARGLPVIGSAGVLLLARERGYIRQVRPLLDAFRPAGRFLSDTVAREILHLAGE